MLGPLRRALAIALLMLPLSVNAPCAGFSDVDDADVLPERHVDQEPERHARLRGWSVLSERRRITPCDCRVPESPRRCRPSPERDLGGAGRRHVPVDQAAIDYAATLLADPRRLVKVAPGTYKESIVMTSGVDVEVRGSARR